MTGARCGVRGPRANRRVWSAGGLYKEEQASAHQQAGRSELKQEVQVYLRITQSAASVDRRATDETTEQIQHAVAGGAVARV